MGAMQRLMVSGRVQRVGYRDYVVRKAQALQVTGWVRNLQDGRVEILASGEEEALAAFLEATRTGPPFSSVADIDVFPAEDRQPKGFTKRFTV